MEDALMQQKAGKARHAWRWSHWKIRGRIAGYEGLCEPEKFVDATCKPLVNFVFGLSDRNHNRCLIRVLFQFSRGLCKSIDQSDRCKKICTGNRYIVKSMGTIKVIIKFAKLYN
ncbi:hypothetical protein [Pseudomonas sp. CHM02]|uniref:hypothetical protein n=1 Tax=Pseudomonas sp. CHM02 TaxID=1463662 RepID=UPI0012DBFC4C|nr:hypothetical protein [Pseudomonas sp. CHM02]